MNMDLPVAFWTWALLNMYALLALGVAGVKARRQGRLAQHRRYMYWAGALVLLFLVAYPVKVMYLGGENLDTWSRSRVIILRIHETFVAVMLLAGVSARLMARSAWLAGGEGSRGEGSRHWHRRLGWFALWSGIGGGVTATMILAGMYGLM